MQRDLVLNGFVDGQAVDALPAQMGLLVRNRGADLPFMTVQRPFSGGLTQI